MAYIIRLRRRGVSSGTHCPCMVRVKSYSDPLAVSGLVTPAGRERIAHVYRCAGVTRKRNRVTAGGLYPNGCYHSKKNGSDRNGSTLPER